MTPPKQSHPILIVDDEPNMRKVVSAMLRREGYDLLEAADGRQALEVLEHSAPACIITDLKMPDVDGLELLARVVEEGRGIPVILMTAHGTVDTAVKAMKQGAFDYLTKPFEKAEMLQVVAKAAKTATKRMSEPSAGLFDTGMVVGPDSAMDRVMKLVDRVATADTTAMITGETGTGKELIAKAIHQKSRRAKKPFIAINCAAIPDELTESELFGYEKGAFTGAVLSKPGRFELADHGTLFLDEVGTLSQKVQGKLLRVLQERSFERVGGVRTISVDTRLVAATNINLKAAVEAGTFREDLYYRLNVIQIPLPPLRERSEDILPLAEHFIRRFSKKLDKPIDGLDDATIAALLLFKWPGNIRELENAMEHAVLLADAARICLDDLPLDFSAGKKGAPEPSGDGTLREKVRDATSRLERQWISEALEKTGNNVTRAAKVLGLSRKGLQLKMKALGLRDSDED